MNNKNIPLWEKYNLTIEEASKYSGIGINKMRDIINSNQDLVIRIGAKRVIKRKKLEEFLNQANVL
ncbi:excisionase [Anaerovoracaceae bacterium SGI.195]